MGASVPNLRTLRLVFDRFCSSREAWTAAVAPLRQAAQLRTLWLHFLLLLDSRGRRAAEALMDVVRSLKQPGAEPGADPGAGAGCRALERVVLEEGVPGADDAC